MSYGYPGPGDAQQPPPQQPPPGQWQPPGQQWQQPGPGWQQPPPPPGWQQPGPGWGGPPPRKSNTGLIVGLILGGAVIVLVGLGVIGVMAVSDDSSKDGGSAARSTASDQSTAEEGNPKEAPAEKSATEEPAGEPAEESGAEGDVKITGCEVDSLTTWASAEVLITNRTSKKADYIINVEFVNSSGKRLGVALAAVNSLAPGQKSEETAQGLDTIKGEIECKVTEVTRYLS
ncbi:hypothetical protein SALBM311S_06993 [Streptomyces alboniger]